MKVLGRAVLILPDKMPERTETGILIPATNKDTTETGTVVQAGKACEGIKAGDRVHFPRKSSSVIVIDGVDHFFSNEHKILYYAKR